MEAAPYFNPEGPDTDRRSEKKDGPTGHMAMGPEAAPAQPMPPAEKPPVVRPPLEGFILIRQSEEAALDERPDHDHEDDDDDDDDSEEARRRRASSTKVDQAPEPVPDATAEVDQDEEPAQPPVWSVTPQLETQLEATEPEPANDDREQMTDWAITMPLEAAPVAPLAPLAPVAEAAPVVASEEFFEPVLADTEANEPVRYQPPLPPGEYTPAAPPAPEAESEPIEPVLTSATRAYTSAVPPMPGGGGGRPPFNPFEHPAFTPDQPAGYGDYGTPSPAASQLDLAPTPTTALRQTERLNRLERRTDRLGWGMLGLLGGLGIEHIVAKNRDLKVENKFEAWRHKFEERQETQQVQHEAQTTQLRQENRILHDRLEAFQEHAAAYRPPETLHPHTPGAQPPPERPQPAPATVRPELVGAVPPVPGQQPEQQLVDEYGRPITLGPNQHIERSAWHNIVVDEHGREVTGAITYGQGFQQERQQERLRDNTLGIGAPQQVPILPTVNMYGAVNPSNGLPSGMTAPQLPADQADAQHRLPSSGTPDHKSTVSTPWFWVMIVLIFAAFFIALLA